jgi:hypothetical protein
MWFDLFIGRRFQLRLSIFLYWIFWIRFRLTKSIRKASLHCKVALKHNNFANTFVVCLPFPSVQLRITPLYPSLVVERDLNKWRMGWSNVKAYAKTRFNSLSTYLGRHTPAPVQLWSSTNTTISRICQRNLQHQSQYLPTAQVRNKRLLLHYKKLQILLYVPLIYRRIRSPVSL